MGKGSVFGGNEDVAAACSAVWNITVYCCSIPASWKDTAGEQGAEGVVTNPRYSLQGERVGGSGVSAASSHVSKQTP